MILSTSIFFKVVGDEGWSSYSPSYGVILKLFIFPVTCSIPLRTFVIKSLSTIFFVFGSSDDLAALIICWILINMFLVFPKNLSFPFFPFLYEKFLVKNPLISLVSSPSLFFFSIVPYLNKLTVVPASAVVVLFLVVVLWDYHLNHHPFLMRFEQKKCYHLCQVKKMLKNPILCLQIFFDYHHFPN